MHNASLLQNTKKGLWRPSLDPTGLTFGLGGDQNTVNYSTEVIIPDLRTFEDGHYRTCSSSTIIWSLNWRISNTFRSLISALCFSLVGKEKY